MDSIRLLVVDDDINVAKVTLAMAEALGAVGKLVTGGSEVLESVDEWNPTHILLDLVMPGPDGVQVMTALARRGCTAEIIICSGMEDTILAAAMRTGVAKGLNVIGVLPKPFTLAELRALLETPNASDRRHAEQTHPAEQSPPITGSQFRSALRNGEIFPVYMPIVDCVVGDVRAVEANARWRHAGGLLMPEQFIPLAERLGLTEELTECIAQQAVRWLAEDIEGGIALTLKLSASSLKSSALLQTLAHTCDRFSIDPRRITLQLSVSSALNQKMISLEWLTRLRVQGFGLSLGNFGAAGCSLMDLVRLPVSELKIDHALSEKVSESRERLSICKCVVGLGTSLGVRVTACGVDSAEDLEFFSDIGAHYAMGFFIAPPMEAEEMDAWIDRSRRSPSSRWQALLLRGGDAPASR